MKEINLFLASDDLMPPGIENDDYDSEGDIHFLEELISNDSLPFPKNESSNFDHHDDPSFPRLPSEPPDVEVFFDFKPDTGVLTTKVVKGISEHYVLMPDILQSNPRDFYHGMNFLSHSFVILFFDTLLPFSSDNEDKVFNLGILASPFFSHQDKIIYDSSKSLMMIYGGDIPLLDVTFLHFYPP
ncbi:hypothetical protein Tco_1579433 [Tanacetum coccineum]